MRRRRRANINVEGLESKVALSGIAPMIVVHPHPFATDVNHFDGSLQGFYFPSLGTPVAPTPPTGPTPPAIALGTPGCAHRPDHSTPWPRDGQSARRCKG